MPWHESADDQRFVNPYNFIRLGKEVQRSRGNEPPKGELTGVIHCVLQTMTPLAIPDAELKRDIPLPGNKTHSVYPFFTVNGAPIIPGSEIRGMIRSAYEAATDSCMSVINNNILSARHPFPRNPGLIRYQGGQWQLIKAEKYMLNTRGTGTVATHGRHYPINKAGEKWRINCGGHNYQTGDQLSFTPGANFVTSHQHAKLNVKVVDTAGTGGLTGYLLLWEDIGNKHHNSIFTEAHDSVGNPIPVACANLDDAVRDFDKLGEIYEDRNELKSYKQVSYKLKRDGSYMPVWYETVQDSHGQTFVYLSQACISRTVFSNRLEGLIGEHKKCGAAGDEYKVCPACRLFGMISGRGGKSLGSSLRFSDAALIGHAEGFSLGNQRLKILAGPKTSSVEFYTRRPDNALTWTYDFKTTGYAPAPHGGLPTPIRQLDAVKPNGRKFYLHNMAVNNNPAMYTTDLQSDQNATMELARAGKQFGFDIFFENITDRQLIELIWTLTLGENPEQDSMGQSILCHKLGHGKPLGLGSVKIIVTSVEKREISENHGRLLYQRAAYDAYKGSVSAIPRSEDDFKRLLGFSSHMNLLTEADMQLARSFFGPFAYAEKIAPSVKQNHAIPKNKKQGGPLKGLSSLAGFDFSAGEMKAQPAIAGDQYKVKAADYLFDLLKIANIHTCDGKNVCYPLADAHTANPNNRWASYQWFAGNRQMGAMPQGNGNTTAMKQSIKYTLPLAAERPMNNAGDHAITAELTLPKLEFEQNQAHH